MIYTSISNYKLIKQNISAAATKLEMKMKAVEK